MSSTCQLLLATNNRGKVLEYLDLLKALPCQLTTPAEIGIKADITETGKTYEENARLKAITLARASNLISLADDSGLEVDALNGEPGYMSARYAGEKAADKDRVAYLLKKLENVPFEKRTARFRCVIAIAAPPDKVKIATGECCGIITFEPRGREGFGYDPVFLFPELGKTMAELSMEVKNRVSHRGKAVQQVARLLKELMAGRN